MYQYCKIFVSGYLNEGELIEQLSQKYQAEPERWIIRIPDCEIYIDTSDEFDQNKQKDFPYGFLYFPYIVELDFGNDIPLEYCISFINDLLSWFWSNHKAAIASWDNELDLINNGGYKNKDVPFPK